MIVLKNINGSGVAFPPTKSVSKCLHEPQTVEAPVAQANAVTVLAPCLDARLRSPRVTPVQLQTVAEEGQSIMFSESASFHKIPSLMKLRICQGHTRRFFSIAS